MGIRIIKQSRWLVVFIGVSDRDQKAVTRCIDAVTQILRLKAPIIEYEEIGANYTREKIGNGAPVEGEVEEEFVEFVINDIDKWKRNAGCTRVGVVFPLTSFVSPEVFEKIVKHYVFDNDTYYSFCYRGDFLNVSKRINCIAQPCGQCGNLRQCEHHSCLLRLIWLLFDSDDRIIDILKDMNTLE